MTPPLLAQFFTVLSQACLAEGGDGDVVCVSPDYLNVANQFDSWLKEAQNTWWTRGERMGFITFSNEQECIYFAKEDDGGFHSSFTVNLPHGTLLLR